MLVLSLGSVLERARRGHGGISLDAIVLATTSWLVAIGLLAVGLALVGAFTASSMSVVVGAAWPWGRPRPATTRPLDRRVLVGLAIVLGGVALRLPVADYALAGRDQGTYALRAQHTLREASLDAVDLAAQVAHPYLLAHRSEMVAERRIVAAREREEQQHREPPSLGLRGPASAVARRGGTRTYASRVRRR